VADVKMKVCDNCNRILNGHRVVLVDELRMVSADTHTRIDSLPAGEYCYDCVNTVMVNSFNHH